MPSEVPRNLKCLACGLIVPSTDPDPEACPRCAALWRDVNLNVDALERAITGALRSAIHAHGPITLDKIGSAVKRVIGNLRNARPEEPATRDGGARR